LPDEEHDQSRKRKRLFEATIPPNPSMVMIEEDKIAKFEIGSVVSPQKKKSPAKSGVVRKHLLSNTNTSGKYCKRHNSLNKDRSTSLKNQSESSSLIIIYIFSTI
jgi:hypothetical protein